MILKAIKQNILSIGKSIDGPIFVKDYEDNTILIKNLEELSEKIKDEKIKEKIRYDVYAIKSGDVGEKNVEFELKNSYLPMLVLHDLNIEHKGLKAQMDYVVITKKFVCILETKLLNGNIEINNKGEFTRIIKNSAGKTLRKEGMYSPITQNQRHVDLLRSFLRDSKLIVNTPVISLVVLANPKTIIYDKYATKIVKNQIIRADQLKNTLEKMMKIHKEVDLAVLTMKEISDCLLQNDVPSAESFLTKYEKCLASEEIMSREMVDTICIENKDTKLISALKQYRYNTSKKEGVKPYFIFNNAQLDELVDKMPTSVDELLNMKGFAQLKVEKYGNDIVEIIKKKRQ